MARYHQLLLDLLVTRGISDPEAFLAPPSWSDVATPSANPAIANAVSHILAARNRGDTIAVFGDRDCDGVYATAIIMTTLSSLGMSPLVHIPHRDEGYGLNREAVHRFGQAGVRLLVCVDNGITSGAELHLAQKLGMDTLVIDHHCKGDHSPECPIVWDSRHCSSTLAMLTSWALLEAAGAPRVNAWRASLNRLAAMASIADCIPMIGEARLLTRLGLRDLARVSNGGLQSLLHFAGVKGAPTSTQIAYHINPVVNASGRMRSPMLALNMLVEKDRRVAKESALDLIAINRERREVQRRCVAELALMPKQHPGIQVFSSETWPRGILGILAGRAVEIHRTPSFVLAPSIDPDVYAGSGRSVPGFSLVKALENCSDLLMRYGGHAMAAGLTIRKEDMAEFQTRLQQYAGSHPPAVSTAVEPEAEISLEDWNEEFARTLLAMEPFGEKMRPPRLLLRGLTVISKSSSRALFSDVKGNRVPMFLRENSLEVGQKLDVICEITYDSMTLLSVYSKAA